MLTKAEAQEILLQNGLPDTIDHPRTKELFLRMCKEGRCEAVRAYIALGIGVESHEDISLETPLIRAAEGKHLAVIDLLVEAGADLEGRDLPGDTALMTAVNWKHEEVAKHLAKHGASLNPLDKHRWNPLTKSIREGKQNFVDLLLGLGADPNAGSETGSSAMQYAATHDHPAIIKQLLAKGGDPDRREDKSGKTVLALAAERGHLAVVQALVAAKADIAATDRHGWTAWMLADYAEHTKVASFLASKSPKNPTFWLHKTFLRGAEKGKQADVEKAIQGKVDVMLRDPEGRTALMLAAANGHRTIVETLVAAGCDPHALENGRCNALVHAARSDQTEIVVYLLGLKADSKVPVKQPTDLWAPQDALYHALCKNNLPMIEALLEAGAPIHDLSHLQTEVVFGTANTKIRSAFLQKLGERGGDLEMIDPDSISKEPLLYRLAYKCDHKLIAALLDAGADINGRTGDGSTVLHYLAFYKTDKDGLKLLKELLERGARYDIYNKYGQSPIDAARPYNRPEVLEVFKEFFQKNLEKAKKKAKLKKGETLSSAFFASFLPKQTYTDALEWLHLGQREIVVGLLEAGLPANPTAPYSHHLLDLALKNDDLALVDLLLAKGADPNLPKVYGGTPLLDAISVAIEKGTLSGVRRLLAAGGDPNQANDWGSTPIQIAAGKNHVECLRLLKEAGADLRRFRYGDAPLIQAAQEGALEACEWLLAEGAFLQARTEEKRNALFGAIEKEHTHVALFLIKQGIDIQTADAKGETPLHVAVKKGLARIIEGLLQAGADPTKPDAEGQTALALARLRPSLKPFFAAFQEPSADDETPLSKLDQDHPMPEILRALYNRDAEAVFELLDKGQTFEARNYRGDTALMIALMHPDQKILEALLETDPDIHATNELGDSAGVFALVYAGDEWKAKLEERGFKANMDAINQQASIMMRIMAFEKAVQTGDILALDRILLKKEIDINALRTHQRPLGMAIEAKDIAITKRLLEYGASPLLRDAYGQTALDLAKQSGHKGLIELVEKAHPRAVKVPRVAKATKVPKKAAAAKPAKAVKAAKVPKAAKNPKVPETPAVPAAPSAPVEEPGARDERLRKAFEGKSVVFTGTFEAMKRGALEKLVAAAGAKVGSSLSKATNILIAGDKAGSKIREALSAKIPIWSEGALMKILEPPKVPEIKLFPSGPNLREGKILAKGESAIPLPEGMEGSLVLKWERVDFSTHRSFGEEWGMELATREFCVGRLFYNGTALEPSSSEPEMFRFCRFTEAGSDYAWSSEDFGGRDGFFCSWLLAALKEGKKISWEDSHRSDKAKRATLKSEWHYGCVLAYESETYEIDFEEKTLSWRHDFGPYDLDR